MLIFDSEVIHNKTEGDGTGFVAEEAGSGGFDKVIRQEKLDKTKIRQFASLFQTVQGFVHPKEDKTLAVSVELDKGKKTKARDNRIRVSVEIDFEKLRERVVGS